MRKTAPVECERNPTLAHLRRALGAPRPGRRALLRMATRPRPSGGRPASQHQPRQGGVLLLVYPSNGSLHLALTRRTEQVANHKGQISLPGGARERSDRSLVDTALRETSEELGIDRDAPQILGSLTAFYIPPSDFRIQPYVAYLPDRPSFHIAPSEVAELLEMPLPHLLDPGAREEGIWELRGRPVVVPFYRLGDHKIWGATAMILSEFEVMLSRACQESARPAATLT
jgi:8-oxo-dGTP pyrophosphatase MutT (NUDIX family)